MQINSVKAMNFKGNNYSDNSQAYEKAIELTERLEDTYVPSSDIKTPGAIALSVGAAGAKTFLIADKAVSIIDSKTNKKLSQGFESVLRKASDAIQNTSSKMITNEGKKLSGVTKKIGGLLQRTEELAKTAYKKIGQVTIDGVKKHSANKALGTVAGIGALLYFIPKVLKQDNNNDGVADIVQKSKSIYDKTNSQCSKFIETAGILSEAAELLS